MEEKWIKLKLPDNFSGAFKVELLSESFPGFRIVFTQILSGEGKRVMAEFIPGVNAYVRTNGALAAQAKEFLYNRDGEKFYHNWAFFRVVNSAYLKWTSEQSSGISDAYGVMHFAFIADDSIIDVITNHEPTITWLP